jgi:molybdenum-dependent DNA-binding transcriptional regulator ModE
VLTQLGGGGGAALSPFGRSVVESYRAMEQEAAVAPRLRRLDAALALAAPV